MNCAALGQADFTDQWMVDPLRVAKINSGMAEVKRLLEKNPNQSVIDIGCFNGYAHNWLAQHCRVTFGYYGIDLNTAAIAYAREHNTGVHYDVVDLFDLPELGRAYDIVFCSRVLIHIENWQEALAALVSVAKIAVVLVVKLTDYELRTYRNGVLHRTFTEKMIRDAAAELGCRCEIPTDGGKHRAITLYRSAK